MMAVFARSYRHGDVICMLMSAAGVDTTQAGPMSWWQRLVLALVTTAVLHFHPRKLIWHAGIVGDGGLDEKTRINLGQDH